MAKALDGRDCCGWGKTRGRVSTGILEREVKRALGWRWGGERMMKQGKDFEKSDSSVDREFATSMARPPLQPNRQFHVIELGDVMDGRTRQGNRGLAHF